MIKNNFKIICTLFLVFAIQFAFAQNKSIWKNASAAGYSYKFVDKDPMQTRFYKLKNGLSVILSINKKEPRIQTLFAVRAGSNTDPKEHTGLAHYLEHMLFKGTDKYGSLDWAKEKPILDQVDSLYEVYNKTSDSTQRKAIYKEIDKTSNKAAKFAIANEYDKMMSSMGAIGTNAHTWVEETVYQEDVPSNAIDRYLAIQAERFRNPILRIFHTELEAVYEEKNRGLDNDGRKVYETMLEALFPTHNYGQQSTIGTIEHLKNPSLTAIRNFYYTYYVPNNMSIIMAGDFNPDEVIKKVDASFSYMKAKDFPPYKPAIEKPITAPIVKEVFGPTPENVTLAFRIPGRIDNQATVISSLVDEIMSNSKAGLIDLNLNKQQKVLNGTSTIMRFKDYAVWQLSGTPKTGQSLDEVKDLLLGQLDLLKKGNFDESIIKAIVANFKLSEIQATENNRARATKIMSSFIQSNGDNWGEEVGFIDAMAKISKQQVIDFAKKYYNNNYVIVYKRAGTDTKIKKVIKPPITPVDVNREKQSDFLKTVNNIPMQAIQPVWLDYNKDIKKTKVGNAEVLYVQNTENDLFYSSYRFEMGSWNSKLLSLASQYLQFLSTDKYSAEDISKEFYKLAGSFSVNVGNTVTNIRLSGLNENSGKISSLFEELIYNCKPDEEALISLKGRIKKSRENAKKNKGAIMQGLVNYAEYGPKNPYNYQLTEEELNNVKAQDLVNLLHSLCNYKHLITYYGPQTLADFSKNIQSIHKLPKDFTEYPALQKFPKIQQTKNEILFAEYDMVQAEIDWIRNTDTYDPKQAPIVDLFNNYFGVGMSSIVFQTLRESKALAYSTYAYYVTPNKKNENYSLVGYIGSQADKINEAIIGMNELLNDLPASEKVLETAKKNMKKTFETERIMDDAIITSYLAAKEKGIDYDIRKQIYEAIDNMTFDDLKKFHQQYLANKPYTYCIVASEKKIKMEDLKKYGDIKKVTLEEVFGY